MTLGALVDAGVPLDALQAGIDSLGLPSCRFEAEEVQRRGFRATKVHVRHEPEHAHRHLHQITEMIAGSHLKERQKELATRIFTRLGEAEAHVHGTTLKKVHFHEVGAVDSIADIVGAAIGWDLLGAERLFCSPIPTGHGSIQIAHGRTSVPAPATAELLKGIPLATSPVQAELTTPTGAAIVATLAAEFGPVPPMTIEKIGYGAGDKDFAEQGNVLRILVGTTASDTTAVHWETDRVILLETNLDDTTGETIGYCVEKLMAAGALDVYTTAIQMKKGRPATLLSVLCPIAEVMRLESLLFSETGTLGIRKIEWQRSKLLRQPANVDTVWGTVAGKIATLPDGSSRFKPEFESCRKIAEDHQIALANVFRAAIIAFETSRPAKKNA